MAVLNPDVTARLDRYAHWREELEKLRAIVLSCGLTEEYKWEEACYVLGEANVVIIHGFKEYCALLFLKGSLMQDPHGILIQQTENVQAGRQIRFASMEEVLRLETTVKEYVQEAIKVEESGLKVEYRKVEDYEIPDELQDAFGADPGFRNAFYALTPGRQKGYLLHFAAPKQSKTRTSRIEKSRDLIFDGFGLQDEYAQSKHD